MRTTFLSLAPVLALAACVAPPPPAQQPAPAPVVEPPVTAPPLPVAPSGEWTDWPLAGGDWVYRQDERGSIALFGPAGANAVVTLRCDRARQRIYLARAGTGAGNIVIRSSSAMKQFAGASTGGEPAYIATEIMPRDSILDAMIFSRGRIAVVVDGQTPLAIPSWAEIARVVEDCR